MQNHPPSAEEANELAKAEKAGRDLGDRLIKANDHLGMVKLVKQCEVTYKEFSNQ
jgi:hypothetical protein